MTNNILEKKANHFRKQAELSSDDPIRIKSLLTRLNVLTVFKPLSDEFSGMALKVGESRFILVNANHSVGKQHFTIAHELYHLFVQENFTSMVCATGRYDHASGEEYNADRFASLLLLPETAIKSIIPEKQLGRDKIELETVLELEHYFSCSRSALLYRLKELKLITSVGYDRFKDNVISSAVKYGFPTDLYRAGNDGITIGNYGVLARRLYDKELISESHYVSLLYDLGMNMDYLNEIFDVDGEG